MTNQAQKPGSKNLPEYDSYRDALARMRPDSTQEVQPDGTTSVAWALFRAYCHENDLGEVAREMRVEPVLIPEALEAAYIALLAEADDPLLWAVKPSPVQCVEVTSRTLSACTGISLDVIDNMPLSTFVRLAQEWF